MKPYDTNILFASTLLGFDEPSCAIQADDQTSSDLRIQSSAMASFFDSVNCQGLSPLLSQTSFRVPEHALNPRDHLMTGRIARFVEVDHPGADEGFEVTLERSAPHGNWRKMSSPDE